MPLCPPPGFSWPKASQPNWPLATICACTTPDASCDQLRTPRRQGVPGVPQPPPQEPHSSFVTLYGMLLEAAASAAKAVKAWFGFGLGSGLGLGTGFGLVWGQGWVRLRVRVRVRVAAHFVGAGGLVARRVGQRRQLRLVLEDGRIHALG